MSTETRTILVVDDSPIIREISCRIFQTFGFEAVETENAAQAIATCQERPVHGVFLDWDLPSMGALDFLQGAAALAPESRPTIILSATENDPQQFTLAKAAGVTTHVLKPFDRQMLEVALRQANLLEGDDESALDRARA